MIHKFFIVLTCLLLVTATNSSLASKSAKSMSHGKSAVVADVCADATQPASLRCARAPSAVFDNNNRLWVAWAMAGHVYVNYSDDLGKTFSTPVAVNRKPEAISARGENRPKIVVRTVGKKSNIYVSWTKPLKKRFTGHIRFSYSNDGGEHFSQPVIVNDDLSVTGHRFEALAINEQGHIYLSWLDKRDRDKVRKAGGKYHGAAVYYTWSDDGGKTFKPNTKVIDHSCECCRVVMKMDQQLPVILWRNIYGKNTRDHSLVKFSESNQPGKIERVSFDNWQVDACPHHGPDMSITDNGVYHLTWFNNAPERHGLFYTRRHSDGRYDSAINFGDYKSSASHPNVLHVGEEVWLVWKQFDGKQESAWLQHSNDSGISWNKPVQLSVAKNSDYPFLLSNNDQVFVQWHTVDNGFQLMPVNQ